LLSTCRFEKREIYQEKKMSILSELLKDIFWRKSRIDRLIPGSKQGSPAQLLELGRIKLSARDIVDAERIGASALEFFPQEVETRQLLTEIEFAKCIETRFPGHTYFDWLKWCHATLKPMSYLEIGVESGQSLQFARSPTRAIGIDPAIRVVHSQEAWVKLFQLPSDDFFASHDLAQVLGAKTVNLVFIDGLHTFDQALKDFMNVERFSDAGTVVLFHDILPVVPQTAQRDRVTNFWIGDTWKVMPILMKHRPDLKIFTIPTYPSGLGVVTGLNPNSTTLWRDFEPIRSQAMALELDNFPPRIDDHLNLVENDFSAVLRLLAPLVKY
jgi:hypothetical protein